MADKFRKFVEEWRIKTPKQKWQTIYHVGGLLSESIGVQVYTTMEIYWFSYVAVVLGFVYFLIASYTIWYYFRQQEYFRGLEGTCSFGIVFAVNCSIDFIHP